MMMDPVSSFSDDSALAEALSKLELVEKENAKLRHGTINGTTTSGAGREVLQLKHQNEELMKVNHQWDLEFRELNENFQRYRLDSQQAQNDHLAALVRLREENGKVQEKYRSLEEVLRRSERENQDLKCRITALEQERRAGVVGAGGGCVARSVGGGRGGMGEGPAGVPHAMVSYKKVKELEEECLLLRQQLKTYQDDFVEERKDRQRMNEEKQSTAVKHEAEVTSLKLQLERTRAELSHYTAEANRLSQQLRMKNQQEEEQYKKHLESKGYLTRSAGGRLPPMDPFVELDEEKDQLIRRSTSGPSPSHSPRLLTRGVDLVEAHSSSKAVHNNNNSSSRSILDIDRSRSPVNIMADASATRHGSSNGILPVPPHETSPYHNGSSYISSHSASTNGRSVSPTPITNGVENSRVGDVRHYVQYGGGLSSDSSSTSPYRSRAAMTNGISNRVGVTNGIRYSDHNGSSYPAHPVPFAPAESKSKYRVPSES